MKWHLGYSSRANDGALTWSLSLICCSEAMIAGSHFTGKLEPMEDLNVQQSGDDAPLPMDQRIADQVETDENSPGEQEKGIGLDTRGASLEE